MIPVFIDTRDVAAQFDFTKEQVDDLEELTIRRVTLAFQQQWKAFAGKELGGTREMYKNSIHVRFTSKSSGMVYLDSANWLANALEMGYASFDMKTGFLKSEKVKYTKDGDPYLTIPFRFSTPGALGESSAFSGKLPKDIYSRVKSLPISRPRLQLKDIPEQYQIPKSRELRNKIQEIKSLSLEDRTSIYEGLERRGGGYMTFRRVSLKSHTDSWIHPGFEERNIAGKALEEFIPEISTIIGDTVDDFLDSQGL